MTAVAPGRPPPPPLSLTEGVKLLPTLDDLARAVDGLVAAGLTTASEATRQKLDVTMKEALRLKLARLGAALRFVNEEIGRYLAQDAAHVEVLGAAREAAVGAEPARVEQVVLGLALDHADQVVGVDLGEQLEAIGLQHAGRLLHARRVQAALELLDQRR